MLALLQTIDELKCIANMFACVCLHNNCYRTIELIDKAFIDEKDLARTTFILSINGKKYYQERAYMMMEENHLCSTSVKLNINEIKKISYK